MLEEKKFDKKGQVTIFVIIAVIIVGGIIAYFVVRGQVLGAGGIPQELVKVFEYYQGCIEEETRGAIQLAETQGGYVDVPAYVPGSDYAPFSSHLNFLGFPVPYWYYAAGNSLIKEQVPNKEEIEKEIEDYVEEGLVVCDFENFYAQGFEISLSEPRARVDIENNRVNVEVNSEMSVRKAGKSGRKVAHNVAVDSKLGKFYSIALEIYEKEKKEAFLEQYATDVLYLYAPVDGVEIQCGPKIWATQEVISGLREGLEENILAIKLGGDYYRARGNNSNYFILDKSTDEAVNFMYLKNWPAKIEIEGEGVDDEIMISEPIGNQQGAGVMGFCYIPYHFVYDVSFPVLIQIYDNEEIFQFPIVVVIDNNVPRESIANRVISEEIAQEEFDLCEFKTQEIEVNLYDVNLNEVDANISYECFDQRCRLGESVDGRFLGVAPACVNGYLHARAEGYAEKRELFSSNSERFKEIIMEREREVDVELKVGGQRLKGTAIATFVRDDGKTNAIALPEQDKIKLSEGSYEVKVYVYGNSSVVIPASTKTECVDVPKSGLLGLFGGTKEKCFDINVPETKIDGELIGGGQLQSYILDNQLEKGKMIIEVGALPAPRSIEELQRNFELFEESKVNLEFSEGT